MRRPTAVAAVGSLAARGGGVDPPHARTATATAAAARMRSIMAVRASFDRDPQLGDGVRRRRLVEPRAVQLEAWRVALAQPVVRPAREDPAERVGDEPVVAAVLEHRE